MHLKKQFDIRYIEDNRAHYPLKKPWTLATATILDIDPDTFIR